MSLSLSLSPMSSVVPFFFLSISTLIHAITLFTCAGTFLYNLNYPKKLGVTVNSSFSATWNHPIGRGASGTTPKMSVSLCWPHQSPSSKWRSLSSCHVALHDSIWIKCRDMIGALTFVAFPLIFFFSPTYKIRGGGGNGVGWSSRMMMMLTPSM